MQEYSPYIYSAGNAVGEKCSLPWLFFKSSVNGGDDQPVRRGRSDASTGLGNVGVGV
jgi:hypothetical protein